MTTLLAAVRLSPVPPAVVEMRKTRKEGRFWKVSTSFCRSCAR